VGRIFNKVIEDGKSVTRKERGKLLFKIEIRLKGPKNNELKKEEENKGCVTPW